MEEERYLLFYIFYNPVYIFYGFYKDNFFKFFFQVNLNFVLWYIIITTVE